MRYPLFKVAAVMLGIGPALAGIHTLKTARTEGVVVDGDLSEWREIAAIRYANEDASIKDWQGGKDFSVQTWFGWDEKNFYLAVDVTDDKHRCDNIWYGDRVVVTFDLDGNKKPFDTSEDVSFLFALPTGADPNLPAGKPYVRQVTPLQKERTVETFKPVILRKDGATVYELAIPWSETGIAPGRNRRVSFILQVGENDAGGLRDKAEGAWSWPPPYNFGDLILIEKK